MNLNLIYTDLIVLANSKESHSSEQVAEMLSCLLEASVQFKIKEDDRLKAKMKKDKDANGVLVSLLSKEIIRLREKLEE